jgi:TnpA family transposase
MSTLKILSAARKRTFDDVPCLTKDARIGYFSIDIETRQTLATLKTNRNKVGFLIQRAYFQAKGRFFNMKKCKPVDQRAAEKVLGLKEPVTLNDYSSQTASAHRKLILNRYKWHQFTDNHRSSLQLHTSMHVDKRQTSEDILFELLNYCWLHRIEIPSYNELATIVTDSFKAYEQDMLNRFSNHITHEQSELLDNFLPLLGVQFTLRELKHIDQGDSVSILTRNAAIMTLYKEAFCKLLPLIDALSLSEKAIKHFSDWIYKSNISQIMQLKEKNRRYLYLLCFIKDQFYNRQDHAVTACQKVLRAQSNKARGHERKCKEKNEIDAIEANRTVMNSAKNSKQILKLIREISHDVTLSFEEKNERIKQLVEAFFEAENPNFAEHIKRMAKTITVSSAKVDYYAYLFTHNTTLQLKLGSLIKAIKFDDKSADKQLLAAVQQYATGLHEFNDTVLTDFLSEKELTLINADDNIPQISKFKVLLFMHVVNGLKDRSLTLEHSYKFRARGSYLISDKTWLKEKSTILQATSLNRFEDGKAVLDTIGKRVTSGFAQVNRRIENNDNLFFRLKADGTWRIKNAEADFDSSKFIPALLNSKRTVMLQDILAEIDSYTQFGESFKHNSLRNANTEIDPRLLFATIMSLATNIGHTDMAKSSRIFSEKALRDTESNWLSNENILKANRQIVKTIQSLPLPTIFNDKHGRLHTSSDGKKVVVAVNSLLANYSYKYYGKEQGISVNSFIDEKQSFFHVNVLTASDREAPYMMDGIVSSKSSFMSEAEYQHIHSTDTHGYTEAIFAGLHFLDVSFAPRIKNVHEQTMYAYESKSTRRQSTSPLAPKAQINKKLILDNWDDILRLIASIKLGYCTASLMFKLLSASQQSNQLYKAMKELGRLIKTNFILSYVDDEGLRKSIQKQLNRVELGQKLTDAVFFGRGSKLMVGLEEEMQRVMGCNTLLRNVIILWNYLFLSDYYCSLQDDAARKEVLDSIASGSVISWRHLNTHGIYEFHRSVTPSFTATFAQMKDLDLSVI